MARDPRRFIVETQDYSMDFVVGAWNRSVSSSSYTQTVDSFAHGLGYAPLLWGMYSIDNGSTWMPVGLNDYYTTRTDCWVESDSSNIYINFTYLDSGSATALVRLWAHAPITADRQNDVPHGANVFYLNTRDYNYSKLVGVDYVPVGVGSTTLYTHNLGYIPEVLCWAEMSNGRISPFDNSSSSNSSYIPQQVIRVTSSALVAELSGLNYHSSTIRGIHFRLYGAENG